MVGYTQYDLLGTRAFATVNIKRPIAPTNNETSRVTPQVVFGVPLSLNQTLTLDYDQSDFGVSAESRRQSQRILTAHWSYNTTNHPLFPSRGTILTATPVVVWNDSEGFDVEPITRKELPFTTHDRSLGLEATAARFWELNDRDSVFASAGAGFARTREHGVRVLASRFGPRTVDSNYGLLDLGIAHSLWTAERVAKDGTSRIEADLHYGHHVDDRFIGYVYEKLNSREGSVSWVRRNAWGTLRLGVGYVW